MAAGPTMSQMAQTTGQTQNAVKTVAPKVVTKDSDQARHSIFGEEEEGDGKTKGTGKEKGATQTGQSQGTQGKGQVKKRKVKLSTLAQRDVAGKEGAAEGKETTKGQATKAKGQAQQAGHAKDLGYKKAAGLLMQQSKITESSVKYQQANQARDADPTNALSPKGQQKWMLNNLIRMTHLCVEQHTGGKAGEAYESRRDCRLIHGALKGLSCGQQKQEGTSTASSSSRTGMSKGEYASAQKKAMHIVQNVLDPIVRPDHMPEYSEVA